MIDRIQPDASATHCPYCALQCGMTLASAGDRSTVVARDFPTNKGGLCRKGWSAAELLYSPDRLTSPLVREHKDAPLRPASWDQALSLIVEKTEAIQKAHGQDSIGVFGGGGLTNETA